jgi:hypothetical protein
VKLDPGAHVFYAFGFALKSGCDMLRDDSDTSRIATFIKGTLRDLIMTLIPPQKCKSSGMLICDEFNLIRDRMVTSQIK